MSGLPDDLVEEILARVPARSLRRLRSTCKKWNTLFGDRRFTKKHFDKAEKEYLHLMLRNNRLSWMSVNLHRLHDNTDPSAIEFKDELSLKNLFNNSYDDIKVFHCNGFLLCTNMSTTIVWNPCTGQTKWIPTNSPNTCDHRYVLGYVNKKSCRDYKILRFLTKLEIFEFSSNSWRVLGSVNPEFKLQVHGVSVKGNTYWIDNAEFGNYYVLSFDFTTERFGPPLYLWFQGYSRRICLYSVREERLSVLLQTTSMIEIWMTNDIIETNVMSWSKFLRLDFNFTRYIWPAYFFIDEENKFAVVSEYGPYSRLKGTQHLYIIEEDKRRIVNLGGEPSHLLSPHLLSYVPSLVQI